MYSVDIMVSLSLAVVKYLDKFNLRDRFFFTCLKFLFTVYHCEEVKVELEAVSHITPAKSRKQQINTCIFVTS